MKEYRVTPLLAQDLSFAAKREISGLAFVTSKTLITCSCGYHERFESVSQDKCPNCGKPLCRIHNAPGAAGQAYFERCYCEVDGDEVIAFRLITRIQYDSGLDEYVPVKKVIKLFSVNRKSLDVSVFENSNATSHAVVEMMEVPDLKPFLLAVIIAMEGYFNRIGILTKSFNFFKGCHWTRDEVESNVYLYALLLKFHLDGLLTTPYPTVEDLLYNGLKINTPKMRQLVMQKPTLFARKSENFIYGQTFPVLAAYHEEMSKSLKAFRALENGEIPYSEFYVELIERGVLELMEFRDVIEGYNSIKKTGKVFVKKTLSYFIRPKTVEVPSRLADVYAEFVRKFYNRDWDIIAEFCNRTEKLSKAGVPQILENYLDKEYYRIINSEKYLYSGKDFQEEFQKDPLQCLKNMK